MDSYNKRNIRVVGWITWISVLGGLFGAIFLHKPISITAALIPLGLTAILFSHDLAMRDFARGKANYKVFRVAYIVVGIVFVVGSIVSLAHLG
jgi:hypothetical protein